MAGDDDLNDDPHLLDGHAGVIIPGHSEYWTRAMRNSIERFIDAGDPLVQQVTRNLIDRLVR